MKKTYFNYILLGFLSLIALWTSCTQNNVTKQGSKNEEENNTNKTLSYTLVEDIDNDGISDTCFVIAPEIMTSDDGMADCIEPCITKINFGSKNLGELIFENSIGGEIQFIEDINEDGIKEMVFFPDWFTSCWSNFSVLSVVNGKWVNLHTYDFYRCMEPAKFEKISKGVLKVTTYGSRVELTTDEYGVTTEEITDIEPQYFELIIAEKDSLPNTPSL
jgi:hypothetical protein